MIIRLMLLEIINDHGAGNDDAAAAADDDDVDDAVGWLVEWDGKLLTGLKVSPKCTWLNWPRKGDEWQSQSRFNLQRIFLAPTGALYD